MSQANKNGTAVNENGPSEQIDTSLSEEESEQKKRLVVAIAAFFKLSDEDQEMLVRNNRQLSQYMRLIYAPKEKAQSFTVEQMPINAIKDLADGN